jgi:2-hydroxycyclohexanecarboxyl-CoA dehydrogenase
VVTGGASGIGGATCRHLADAGHRVGVLDLDEGGAQRVAEELRTKGAQAIAIAVDVTDPMAVNEGFDKVRSELGPVLVLVTSAGQARFEEFDKITPASWQHILEVNLTGTFYCCQAAVSDMIAARWGRIITISSSSAQRGAPYMAHYSAAKGGVIALTKSLAGEFAKFGITVNNIPPSGIDSPMQHKSQEDGNLPPKEVLARRIPVGHLGTPDDIAAAAVFLASDSAGFITGQVIGVNGGAGDVMKAYR